MESATGATAKEGHHMKRINWDRALESLVLVRLGQDLGHDTPIARFVHDAIDMILTAAKSLF